MTETRHYHNDATQAEKREVLRNDSYFSRQQNAIDDSGGRFAKLTPATITGVTPVPSYPSLPPNSPWANGFDNNIEPPFPVDIEAHEPVGTPVEIKASIEPELIPQVAASPSTTEVDRTGEEPIVGSTVDLPSTDAPVIGSFARRRNW